MRGHCHPRLGNGNKKLCLLWCTGLTSIVIPDSVTKIGFWAFDGCTGLKAINVPAKKADYYKKRLPEKLHSLIVELPAEKKKK